MVSAFNFLILIVRIAKVGFDFDSETGQISTVVLPLVKDYVGEYGDVLKYGLHAVFIVLMILANILMIRFYVLSMQLNGAAKATVYNFAVNYLASISLGSLFFGEAITARLCLGVSLVLTGTAIISTCQEEDQVKTKKEKIS